MRMTGFSGRKIAVTGGAGFIGGHLTRRLIAMGAEITVVDDLSVGRREGVAAGAHFFEGDVRDVDLLRRALDGCDAVVHLAARVALRDSLANFRKDAETNIGGTLAVLEAVRDSESVSRFVFASSMAVYGDTQLGQAVRESDLVAPASPYGIAKSAAELYVKVAMHACEKKWFNLRIFNTYGPGQALSPYTGVVTIFRERMLRGQPLIVYGDGRQIRDYVHVADVVAGLIGALQSADADSGAYNIGSSVGTTVLALADRMGKLMGANLEIEYEPASGVELNNSIADIEMAKKYLGYAPTVSLDAGLTGVVAGNA